MTMYATEEAATRADGWITAATAVMEAIAMHALQAVQGTGAGREMGAVEHAPLMIKIAAGNAGMQGLLITGMLTGTEKGMQAQRHRLARLLRLRVMLRIVT